ncbi:MAG: NUDIX hydrolase [Oscillospiraceae bacterium]|nr:NUDIX hydrolase [Oscillospiraceae bacterium]
MERPNVRVGVGVCAIRDGKFLIGKRLGSHGENTYAFPGGHLEFGESWEETAIRETFEETGLHVENPRFMGITNDVFEKENKHYITIFIAVDSFEGVPEVMEPNKCEGWYWVDIEELPRERFVPLEHLLQSQFRENFEKELSNSLEGILDENF